MVLWCTRKPLHCKQQAVSFENSRVSCPAGTFADDHPEIVLTKGQSVRDTKSVFFKRVVRPPIQPDEVTVPLC
jgi:hypothetical protein